MSVALQRMVAQRLVGPGLAGGAEVVRHLACVQAQDLPGALASVRLRTAAGGVDVAEALATGEVVRSWPMRGTLHLVAGEDLGWMLGLTGPRLISGAAARRRALGLTEDHARRAEDLARGALVGAANINRAKKMIRKAFEKHMNNQGLCYVELLSPCPTNWNLAPLKAKDFLLDEMTKHFPLGEFKGGDAK